MAKAEIRTIPPVPVEPVKEVVLTLTMDEAKALATLTGRCGVGTVTSPIYRALTDLAGVYDSAYMVTGYHDQPIPTLVVRERTRRY